MIMIQLAGSAFWSLAQQRNEMMCDWTRTGLVPCQACLEAALPITALTHPLQSACNAASHVGNAPHTTSHRELRYSP